MITIDNGNTGEPIIEAIKEAFSKNSPVKLTIEQDDKTIVIPALADHQKKISLIKMQMDTDKQLLKVMEKGLERLTAK